MDTSFRMRQEMRMSSGVIVHGPRDHGRFPMACPLYLAIDKRKTFGAGGDPS
jgi:hypothetical protein